MFAVLLVLALAFSNPVVVTHAGGHDDASRVFNYVVVIVMENHGLGEVIGSSSAPFMNHLATSSGFAMNYTAIDHPSLPNYLGLISGQAFSSWSVNDCSPSPGCSAGAAPNLVDSMERRGLTWKAYMEGYPSSCGSQCSPGGCFLGDDSVSKYGARHDPFVYFDDIVNSTTRCSRIVPANSTSQVDDALLSDLSSPSTASNFMWLTPNLCNDTHDCSLATGDNYLSELVPRILSSKVFENQKAALFITFDEGIQSYPKDLVYSVWTGSVAKENFQSNNAYSHYSFLSTIESVWHLRPLTSNDASAMPMTEFFVTHHPDRHGQQHGAESGKDREE
ncbi:MAG TPA: alkaline phosphatase family protein [Candidatus Dormibacteraeota bacterium]|jgi:hypothetical protein|nr:alkaline phosphatase family protein [Candidatus Dormibacteraeota bacterium]